MLTGDVPFTADSMVGVIQHHYMTPVPDVLAVRDGVPKELLDIVYCALNKDPNDRFPTTKDMAVALDNVQVTDAELESAAFVALNEPAPGGPIVIVVERSDDGARRSVLVSGLSCEHPPPMAYSYAYALATALAPFAAAAVTAARKVLLPALGTPTIPTSAMSLSSSLSRRSSPGAPVMSRMARW